MCCVLSDSIKSWKVDIDIFVPSATRPRINSSRTMIIRPVSCCKPGGGLPYKNDGDAGRKRLRRTLHGRYQDSVGVTGIFFSPLRDTNSKITRFIQSYFFLDTLKRIEKVPSRTGYPKRLGATSWALSCLYGSPLGILRTQQHRQRVSTRLEKCKRTPNIFFFGGCLFVKRIR